MNRPTLLVLVALLSLLAMVPLLSDESDAAETIYAEPEAKIGNTTYATLSEALDSAKSGDTVLVVGKAKTSYYINNDLRIKAGVTLVIPYSSSDKTGHDLGKSENSTTAKLSGAEYRYIELIIGSKNTITVEGTLILGGITGRPAYFDYQGHTSSYYSQITLGGKIVLKSGSELYSYGYIKGTGNIVANPNSSVYEPLIILDYTGGDNMVNLYECGQAAFNRYAFLNIQCMLTVNSGANMYGCVALYAQDKFYECNVNIVGPYDSIMSLEPKASVTFTYNKDCYLKGEWTSNIWNDVGKTTVSISGGATFGTISLNIMDNYIGLEDNYFSIPYNFDYELDDGVYSINAHYRILPGATIIVGENAVLDVKVELIAYYGLTDIAFDDKYYPLPDTLKSYGFRTSGALIVKGTLNICSGSSFAGIIEGDGEKSTVVVEEETEIGSRTIEFGCDHKSKKYGITKNTKNLTTRTMCAQLVSTDGYLITPEVGCTYKFGGTGTYILKEYVQSNGKYKSGQTFMGTWTLYEKGTEYTYLPWENDVNGNVIGLDDIRNGLGLIDTHSGKYYLIRIHLDCYGVITVKYDAIKEIVKCNASLYISSNDYHEIFTPEMLSDCSSDLRVNEVTVYAKSVTIIGEEEKCIYMNLNTPEAYSLEAVVKTQYTTDKTLRWTSSDESVALVDGHGKLYLMGLGETIIKATTTNGRVATCTLVVEIPVESVQIVNAPEAVSIGSSDVYLSSLVLPENATNKNILWTSSDPSILSIDANGRMTALREGTVKVTVTSERGPTNTVTLKVVTLPKKITMVSPTKTVGIDETITLDYTLTPANAYNAGVTWSSSNTGVVNVTSEGLKAVGTGDAIITVTTANGFSDTCKVTVTAEIISIEINCSVLSLQPLKTGKNTGQLSVSYYPENATNKKVTWSSSDTKLATVDANGKVTAKRTEGTVTITAVTDNGVKATCLVVISNVVEKVTLNVTEIALSAGEQYQLTAKASPTPEYLILEWASENPAIASVDENGLITAVSSGTVTINVTANGTITKSCTVTVHPHAEAISLNAESMGLPIGEEYKLKATVLPSTVVNKKVTWSSSDNGIVSVSDDGTIRAISKGTAIITATAEDSGATAECTVTVTVPVTSVKLDRTSKSMEVGETFTLKATVNPENADNTDVTWSVSRDSVISLNEGKIIALSPGTVTVTVKTVDGGYTATCKVTVRQHAESVKMNNVPTSGKIEMGNSLQLSATVYPSSSYNKTVIWKSSDTSVLTVENGLIKGVGMGTATITVTTVDGGLTASCTLEVTEPTVTISIDRTSLTLPDIGSTDTLVVDIQTYVPEKIELVWTSDNEGIVTVSNGVLTAISTGTAMITATETFSGQYVSCYVTVECLAKSLTLSEDSLELEISKSAKITAKVLPSNTTNKNVTWSSSDTTIATVSGGEINAISTGTVTITATTSNGLISECTVTIYGHVYGVELDRNEIVLPDLTEKDLITATVLNDNAKDLSVIWSSEDESIVFVDNSGAITAIGKGTTTVTVTTVDGGFTADCKVTVNAKVKSISLDKGKAEIGIGGVLQIIATVGPTYANNKNVTWNSENPSVVSINEEGVCTAVSKGSTVITAITEDGGFTAACVITVIVNVNGISLDKSEITIADIGLTQTLTATIEPEDAEYQEVIWYSDNESIATVDNHGTITGVGIGTATVTVRSVDGGYMAACEVKVEGKVKEITLDKTELVMESEGASQITMCVIPEMANKDIVWFSSDDSVATVDSAGRITAIDNGQATIICKDNKTGIYAECEITVYTHANTVRIEPVKETVYENGTYTLYATVGPDKAVNKNVVWAVDDEALAKIDVDGTLTTISTGTVNVTATTKDGGYVDKVSIEICPRITAITVDASIVLYETQSIEFNYTIEPAYSPEKVLVNVDSQGVIKFEGTKMTAISAGTAMITLMSESGFVQSTCIVTVTERDLFEMDTVTIKGDTITFLDLQVTIEKIESTQWNGTRPLIPIILSTEGEITLKAGAIESAVKHDVVLDISSDNYHITMTSEELSKLKTDTILNKHIVIDTTSDTLDKSDAEKLIDEVKTNIVSEDVTPTLEVIVYNDPEKVTLEKEFRDLIAEEDVNLKITKGIYEVTLSKDIIDILEGDVELGVKKTSSQDMNAYQKKTIGNKYATSLELTSNGIAFHSLGGKATISIAYTLSEGEDVNNIQVWYVDENSTHSYKAVYSNGYVTFETDHFSCYVIAFEDPPKQELEFNQDSMIMIAIIVASIILVLLILIVIVVRRRKSRKH